MEKLKVTVDTITYHNEENGYSILRCIAPKELGTITIVGNMPETHPGSVLNVEGYWKRHPKYGEQFCVEKFEEALPATSNGIKKYLGSGLIKGIGPVYASKIVDFFGEKTMDIIEETPERLLEVDGIGPQRVEKIKVSWEAVREIKNIMLFLQSHDISTTHATKIYKTYGNESIKIVENNPYKLADDIYGIGFRTADAIAEHLGFGHEKFVRIRAGIIYTLNQMSDNGHCYAVKNVLISEGAKLLEVGEQLVENTLMEMLQSDDDIEVDETEDGEVAIYNKKLYFAEFGVANKLKRIYSNTDGKKIGTIGLSEKIEQITGMHYDDMQKEAITSAMSSKVFILTGGPGTGKTTVTKGIVEAFKTVGAKILLAAPTGRAAKRMSETIGMESKTIHRLLEFKPPNGYQINDENPLSGDVLIVDECSMIDITLMNNLLKAVPLNMNVVLIGDVDQLPSVGPGNVLADIIDSGVFPVVRLTKIFRQAQESRIIMNAHTVNHGHTPELVNDPSSDFFFIEEDEADNIPGLVVDLVQMRLPKYCGVNPRDIQVLIPMQRGTAGAGNLNTVLQQNINPYGSSLRKMGTDFRVNDKVMQVRNNYDKEVFNGDIGIITSVNTEDNELTIDFDGRKITYEQSELDEVRLAYATTIHKAQGSEYPVVVMPILMSHYMMLQRNLVYTGITRAKSLLVLVGSRKAIGMAVHTIKSNKRNTLLKKRLQEERNV